MAVGSAVQYGGRQESSNWAIADGVILVIVGIIAIFARYSIANALTLVFPLLLVVKGILEIVAAFRATGAGGALWDLAFGIIAILAGSLLFARPALSGLTLVAILAGYFLIEGIARLVIGFSVRGPGTAWGWAVGVGILDIVLGIVILSAPSATLLVIAWLIGLNILAAGIAMIGVGVSERSHNIRPGMTPA